MTNFDSFVTKEAIIEVFDYELGIDIYGNYINMKRDCDTGELKYCLVEVSSDQKAEEAVTQLNGYKFPNGYKPLKVTIAGAPRPHTPFTPRDSNRCL